ncbi:MAG: FAD-dependent oxidoreductase [Clostridia bacterium]|nr:FAD-dependent oxidoreductase [Clostridia bacterium]
MKKSVWTDEVKMPSFNNLEGDKRCEVLIIGGGLCGILCAYYLKNKGIDCVVVEGGHIAGGITENTTGKITYLHSLIYSDLLLTYGKEKAQMYLKANMEAMEEYKKLCENIECEFEIKDAYTYSRKSRVLIEREVRCIEALGGECEFCEKTELPFEIKGAVKAPGQAQFNPLMFIKEIAKDLNIFENTFAYGIENGAAVTDMGRIQTEKIIVCTHFPFLNKHGSYFLKLYQHRSYVAAFENVPTLSGMYVDEDMKGMSFRSYKNLMLIGGGGHRTGKKGTAWSEAEEFARNCYPLAKLKYEWAAQDCMSLDKVPYIGKYSKNTPDLYVATGFNKWGMSNSMVAARLLSDMVLGKENEYEPLFLPQRKILHPQLLINGIESTVNLLTPTTRRCSHLGCALKWNRYEHTWDCPCHGSRFSETGEVIDNPAMHNIGTNGCCNQRK